MSMNTETDALLSKREEALQTSLTIADLLMACREAICAGDERKESAQKLLKVCEVEMQYAVACRAFLAAEEELFQMLRLAKLHPASDALQ